VEPNTSRVFPFASPDGPLYRLDLAYPRIDPVFSSTLAGILSAIIPLAIFLIAQIWVRSFSDFGAAVLGLGYSLVTGTCFQIILKKLIGGFRPHFLEVCQPTLPSQAGLGTGFQNIMYRIDQVCNSDNRKHLIRAMESFPSGHATIAFAAFGYLAIYLFTHLRVLEQEQSLDGSTTRHFRYWRMLLVVLPILFATYLSSTLVSGYHHHAHDVIFGALIGATMALVAYRLVYKGILSEKWNTVPYLDLKKDADAARQEVAETYPV
jgi:diacylglycerol diphosphate phosphatase/phosphatidate phosphatase